MALTPLAGSGFDPSQSCLMAQYFVFQFEMRPLMIGSGRVNCGPVDVLWCTVAEFEMLSMVKRKITLAICFRAHLSREI